MIFSRFFFILLYNMHILFFFFRHIPAKTDLDSLPIPVSLFLENNPWVHNNNLIFLIFSETLCETSRLTASNRAGEVLSALLACAGRVLHQQQNTIRAHGAQTKNALRRYRHRAHIRRRLAGLL